MSDRDLREVPGFGSSLRSQLAALGWSQSRLASESGLSRQTISRAINHDELSEKTERTLAAALGRAPSERPGTSRSHKSSATPILGRALCDATDLEAWANRRESQSLLPLLIRRLIRDTTTKVTEFQVRTGEGVHLPGWDGVIQNGQGTPFVPEGMSGWEMSVAADPRDKAEKDYGKRSEDSSSLVPEDATFVFVTLRRWGGRDVWAAEKTEGGPWARVKVLDADDVAAWLEEVPPLHVWLSIQMGKIPVGINDLEAYWNAWAGATRPALTPAAVLSGRADAIARMHRCLADLGGGAFAVQAESREEAIAWIYCVIRDLPAATADSILARCLVVESPDALRHLTSASPPLVLVPAFDPGDLASAAVRAGHAVVIPMDRSGLVRGENAIRVPPISRERIADFLRESGETRDGAYLMAGLAVRSMTAFRRRFARTPAFRKPEWSKPGVARGLIPALMIGSWDEANRYDCQVLSQLGGRPYEELAETLLASSVGSDPLVGRKQNAWYLISPEDAWWILSGYLLRHDLERFRDVALTVLGRVDPALDLPPNQRWMAGALGKNPEHSRLLRDGLATMLVIMAAQGEEAPSPTSSARDMCEQVIGELLVAANADWRLWASLRNHLPSLAEAAPDCFLDSVEEGLREKQPPLRSLFGADDPMPGFHLHTGLLQALEVLAWSPDHLGRVVSLLAKLALLDPESNRRLSEGGRGGSAHRPLSVLKAIFRSWLPETSAPLEERFAALDGLRRSHGLIAWAVMISMLPEMHSAALPSTRPTVRDWALDARRPVCPAERARTVAEVVVRVLEDAGTSGRRWGELLGHLHVLPRGAHDLVVDALRDLGDAELTAETRATVWGVLRSIIARHRAHGTAKWAMPEEYGARLEGILRQFSPQDPVTLFGWLFAQRPPRMATGVRGKESWEDRKKLISSERARAATAILDLAGLDGLTEVATAVENPWELGFAAASAPSALLEPDDFLGRHLGDSQPALREMARGYAAGRADIDGEAWLVRQLERPDFPLTVNQRAELLLVFPLCASTWRVATACGDDVSLEYWRKVSPHHVEDTDLSEAVACLTKAGRPFAAVDLLAFDERVNKGVVPPDIVAQLLDAAASVTGKYDAPGANFSSDAAFLLDALQRAKYDHTALARLEWRLMPVLSHHERRPEALHRLLAQDPEFFVEMLSLVYHAHGSEPEEVDDHARRRASSAYSVLDSWRSVPGQHRDGGVDGTRLEGWVEQAERHLRAGNRLAIGHRIIGQVLSGCPHDPDGTWPCKAVRDVIEGVDGKDLERGFAVGVMNGRGVIMRNPAAGGASERALAERYDGYAAAVRASHPSTAGILRRIAQEYRQDGSWQDYQLEMREAL